MSELTAALATIEKCREITNCPAGVDLQDHLRKLAAENVALKDCVANHAPAVDHWNAWADQEDKIKHAPETPALNSVQSVVTVSDAWIPVSERMPEVGDIVLTAMGGSVNVGEMERSGANYRYFTSVISGRELPATHWMPLPAAPQEVKSDINALIPLVSRNEQEVK